MDSHWYAFTLSNQRATILQCRNCKPVLNAGHYVVLTLFLAVILEAFESACNDASAAELIVADVVTRIAMADTDPEPAQEVRLRTRLGQNKEWCQYGSSTTTF